MMKTLMKTAAISALITVGAIAAAIVCENFRVTGDNPPRKEQ